MKKIFFFMWILLLNCCTHDALKQWVEDQDYSYMYPTNRSPINDEISNSSQRNTSQRVTVGYKQFKLADRKERESTKAHGAIDLKKIEARIKSETQQNLDLENAVEFCHTEITPINFCKTGTKIEIVSDALQVGKLNFQKSKDNSENGKMPVGPASASGGLENKNSDSMKGADLFVGYRTLKLVCKLEQDPNALIDLSTKYQHFEKTNISIILDSIEKDSEEFFTAYLTVNPGFEISSAITHFAEDVKIASSSYAQAQLALDRELKKNNSNLVSKLKLDDECKQEAQPSEKTLQGNKFQRIQIMPEGVKSHQGYGGFTEDILSPKRIRCASNLVKNQELQMKYPKMHSKIKTAFETFIKAQNVYKEEKRKCIKDNPTPDKALPLQDGTFICVKSGQRRILSTERTDEKIIIQTGKVIKNQLEIDVGRQSYKTE